MTMTVLEHVGAARDRLAEAGLAQRDAAFDAELLARHALGWDRATYVTSRHAAPPATFPAEYATLVARRARREPVSIITGHREFWGLDFDVTPAVLTPRPETELIIEEALALLEEDVGLADAPWRIVDVGTGSGCLAVALACELPGARISATDVSEAALAVAKRNAAKHGVADRITFARAPFLDGVDGTPHLVVANPPYVPTAATEMLAAEVGAHEPRLALDGGPDGLDCIRALLEQAAARLASGGHLVLEFGLGQDDAMEELVADQDGLDLLKLRHDLQDIPRTAVVRRSARGTRS